MKKFLSRSIATMMLAGLAFTLSACNRQPPLEDNTVTSRAAASNNNLAPAKGKDTIYIVTNESQLIKLYKEQVPQSLNIIRDSVGIYPHDVSIDNDQHLHISYNIKNLGNRAIKSINFTSFVSLKFNNSNYHSPANLILAIPLKYDLTSALTDAIFNPQTAIDLNLDYNLKDLYNHENDVSVISQYGVDQLSFANEINIISSVTFANGQTIYMLPQNEQVKTIANKHDDDTKSSTDSSQPQTTPKVDKANLTDD